MDVCLTGGSKVTIFTPYRRATSFICYISVKFTVYSEKHMVKMRLFSRLVEGVQNPPKFTLYRGVKNIFTGSRKTPPQNT